MLFSSLSVCARGPRALGDLVRSSRGRRRRRRRRCGSPSSRSICCWLPRARDAPRTRSGDRTALSFDRWFAQVTRVVHTVSATQFFASVCVCVRKNFASASQTHTKTNTRTHAARSSSSSSSSPPSSGSHKSVRCALLRRTRHNKTFYVAGLTKHWQSRALKDSRTVHASARVCVRLSTRSRRGFTDGTRTAGRDTRTPPIRIGQVHLAERVSVQNTVHTHLLYTTHIRVRLGTDRSFARV